MAQDYELRLRGVNRKNDLRSECYEFRCFRRQPFFKVCTDAT